MQRWVLSAVAILLLSIAVPIARSSGPWTAAATATERTLVFDTHHELLPSSIYSDEEHAEMAAQIALIPYLSDPNGQREVIDLVRFPESPNVGTEAPGFSLVRTDGRPLELAALRGRIAVFMFASMTNPPARLQLPRLDALRESYARDEVEIFVVYGRESHPGAPGFEGRVHPESDEAKRAHARELAALTRLPVAIDGLDAPVQELYGGVPNSAWVVDREGTIVFRATWADADKLGQVVDRLMRFERNARG